jgi:hypothetical protein
MKFQVRNLHLIPMSVCEFSENKCSESYSVLKAVTDIFPHILCIFIVCGKIRYTRCSQHFIKYLWVSWKSVQGHCTSLGGVSYFLSLLFISVTRLGFNSLQENRGRLGSTFLVVIACMKFDLCLYWETVLRLARKELFPASRSVFMCTDSVDKTSNSKDRCPSSEANIF